MYVMQTESKKWPEKGVYHWDVTDMHNMQSVAISLEDFKNKSIRVMQSGTLPDVEESRKYNSLISKLIHPTCSRIIKKLNDTSPMHLI